MIVLHHWKQLHMYVYMRTYSACIVTPPPSDAYFKGRYHTLSTYWYGFHIFHTTQYHAFCWIHCNRCRWHTAVCFLVPNQQLHFQYDCHLHITMTHPCSDNMTHPHNVCLVKIFADAKHACLIVKKYDSPTECTSCEIFADAKHACMIIKNYDSLTKRTFCKHFMQCKMRYTYA